MSAEGVGVIFITHRMDEISEIGDRITVMRSGETVATLERGAWTPRELVHLMTGSDRLTEHAREDVAAATARIGETVLSVKGIALQPGRRPIDLASAPSSCARRLFCRRSFGWLFCEQLETSDSSR